ncbi:Histone-lysine N-methyltransferase SETMAR [Eumeta japonica]|uniref:Histone-lysine N-methyltransferase SETMAR n=1 Tax=Eumeta variegata TaxID=151549 RepID=A0A4C1XIN9_EUMVA|nr:Histone-lysine N-methyltransferase SETMAR [Eumeta japonica]
MIAIQDAGFETLEHPPHSSDLVPSDFYLFSTMTKCLKVQRFEDDETRVTAAREFLGWQNITEHVYYIHSLVTFAYVLPLFGGWLHRTAAPRLEVGSLSPHRLIAGQKSRYVSPVSSVPVLHQWCRIPSQVSALRKPIRLKWPYVDRFVVLRASLGSFLGSAFHGHSCFPVSRVDLLVIHDSQF